MSEDGAEAHADAAGLIVLDGDPAERERIEAMAEELGVEVWAAAPEDLVPERSDTWESLAQARAVVVAAQFGPRSGLEIIESLAWSSGPTPHIRALSLDRPNRAWIEAALRAGATTCVLRPLDAAELKSKVIDASAEATPNETGADAEDAAPGAPAGEAEEDHA